MNLWSSAFAAADSAHWDISGPLLLLAVAAAVALAVRAVRIPYTIALVLTGLLLGLSQRARDLFSIPPEALIADLIFLVLLPPLLFEGCVHIDLETLRHRARLIVSLAFLGTLLTAAITGVAAALLIAPALGLQGAQAWLVGLLIGIIVAPTDPASVLALFKELGVQRELAVVVEGESVLNDGVGVVAFLLLLELLGGHALTVTSGLAKLLWEVGGGATIGLTIGYLAYRLLRRVDDHLIETVLSLLVAYGAYLVADAVHASGVLSVVVAGLVIGNYGTTFGMSPTTRLALTSFWEVLAFLANSVLFLTIGLVFETSRMFTHLGWIVLIFGVGLLGRAVSVALCDWLGGRRRRVTRAWLVVIGWSGVRGSIPIAMVLGLAGTTTGGLTASQSEAIVAITFGVVLLSLLAQGLTIKPLLRRLGVARPGEAELAFEAALGQAMAIDASLAELARMHDSHELGDESHADLAEALGRQREQAHEHIGRLLAAEPSLRQSQGERAGWRLLQVQRAALDEAVRRGIVSEQVRHQLGVDIDARLPTILSPLFTLPEQAPEAGQAGSQP